MDRHFRTLGRAPVQVDPLDRLAWLGTRTMGALTYHPPAHMDVADEGFDLAELARASPKVLDGASTEVLPRLLQADFRILSMDYLDLMKVTRILTRNHLDTVRAFRRLVFNVLAHNRDDHVKNVSVIPASPILLAGRQWRPRCTRRAAAEYHGCACPSIADIHVIPF